MGEPGDSNHRAGPLTKARQAVQPGAHIPYGFTACLIMNFLAVTIVACALTDK